MDVWGKRISLIKRPNDSATSAFYAIAINISTISSAYYLGYSEQIRRPPICHNPGYKWETGTKFGARNLLI